MNKPTIVEVFADDGQHSHWQLLDTDTGEALWSEDPVEDAARKDQSVCNWGSLLNGELQAAKKPGLGWKWCCEHFELLSNDKTGEAQEFRPATPVVSVLWFRLVALAAAHRIRELEGANRSMLEMWDYSSKKINWGSSFFDARAIELMNTAPAEARKVLDA